MVNVVRLPYTHPRQVEIEGCRYVVGSWWCFASSEFVYNCWTCAICSCMSGGGMWWIRCDSVGTAPQVQLREPVFVRAPARRERRRFESCGVSGWM